MKSICVLMIISAAWGNLFQNLNPWRNNQVVMKSGTEFPAEDVTKVSACGLRNLGNTCYMNSILQSLFHISSIRTHVSSSIFADSSIGESLKIVFRELSEGRKVSTEIIAKKLELNVFLQEDAQEFFLKLIGGLDSSYASFEGIEKFPFSKILRGQMEQVIECKTVDFESRKKQNFLDLSVDVEGMTTLEAGLHKYFEVDNLVGYKAGEHGRQDAEKRIAILSIPSTICFHLKRFAYDINSDCMTKISGRLEFPFSLKLDKYLAKSTESSISPAGADYELNSIVIHDGTPDFGHYTCLVRPDPFAAPDQWILLDDSTVSSVSIEEVQNMGFGGFQYKLRGVRGFASQNAYMLFYARKG